MLGELRTAGCEGEGLCSGTRERSATIVQDFKQPTAAKQSRRGHGKIGVRHD